MKKSKKKWSISGIVLNVFLIAFISFLVFLIIRHNIKQKEDGKGFYNGFNYEILNGEIVLDEYLGSEAEITIPSEIEEMKVVSIAKDAFKNNIYVEKLVIPGSVRAIGISAFQGCINLKTVEIGKGTELICSYAFRNCKALESAKLPETLTEIGYGAFIDAGDVTIYGKADSVAEEYAQEYDFHFEYSKE